MNDKDILLADGGGEWFLYRTPGGAYYVRYTREFFMRRSGLVPSFEVDRLPLIEEVSEEEAREIWQDIRDYYGTAGSVFGEEVT